MVQEERKYSQEGKYDTGREIDYTAHEGRKDAQESGKPGATVASRKGAKQHRVWELALRGDSVSCPEAG